MPFNKLQILAMSPATVDQYVAEQVFQWALGASVKLDSGGVEVGPCFLENLGMQQIGRPDGTRVDAAQYSLHPMPAPDFTSSDWPGKIIDHMARRGFRFDYRRISPNAAAVFFTTPSSPEQYIELPDPDDAVRRAALLAVQ